MESKEIVDLLIKNNSDFRIHSHIYDCLKAGKIT